MKKYLLVLLYLVATHAPANAENGYDLWLRYVPIENKPVLAHYRQLISGIHVIGKSPSLIIALNEITRAGNGLLNLNIPTVSSINKQNLLVLANTSSPLINKIVDASVANKLGKEGFAIMTRMINGKQCILITGNTDIAILYGTFHFLRLLQTQQPIDTLNIVSTPRLRLRMMNHWDNLDRTVERGYAGFSIWNWHTLPGYLDPRYTDYARAAASIGLNGTVLTNVNANATVLTAPYLEKVKALADIFRPYGIRVYLTARFSAPIELGGLNTADPLDDNVRRWWKEKAAEIYSFIPDFGGFLVKANSEGQPGPQDYQRSHADGANMLADAVAPQGGIVIWRAFVYSNSNPADRHKQAYDEFVPLDGSFRNNVMVQVKNGAIDFMPREPFHPLFGKMPKTPLMMEFQVTQEYLGQSTNLVYLAPLFKETLESDTRVSGRGSTVARVIDGTVHSQSLTGMAGVANIGNDINWCGHPFAQANWYALGRLSWDHTLSSESIAREWLGMTFSNNPAFLQNMIPLMMESRETMVRYSNPIGLHHIMGTSHHYGPAPWVHDQKRPEWNPVYYHQADSKGIGFDRTATGSNALAQYHPDAARNWQDPKNMDERFLLWFHHLPWNFKMKSGRTLWDELCYYYYRGADDVKAMQATWDKMKKFIDTERFTHVAGLLKVQHEEAIWWRNSCLLYFQTHSGLPIPPQYPPPDKTLDYYKSLKFPYAPGI